MQEFYTYPKDCNATADMITRSDETFVKPIFFLDTIPQTMCSLKNTNVKQSTIILSE